MTRAIATARDLLEALGDSIDTPLAFVADGERIRPGYHVTEVKRADVRGLDCGRGTEAWTEIVIQLLDGGGGTGERMGVGKFSAILREAVRALAPGDDARLVIEFAPGNAGMRRFSVADVGLDEDAIDVRLADEHAVCKPAARRPSRSACCDGSAKAACCAA